MGTENNLDISFVGNDLRHFILHQKVVTGTNGMELRILIGFFTPNFMCALLFVIARSEATPRRSAGQATQSHLLP
jgi:hypothetical protein